MSQKVTIWIFFLLLVIITNCEVTVTVANSSNTQTIIFKNPTVDTNKHIRMEFSHTFGVSIGQSQSSVALCGTHNGGETLMTNNNTPGFLIQIYCATSGGCDPSSGNNILPKHFPGKFR